MYTECTECVISQSLLRGTHAVAGNRYEKNKHRFTQQEHYQLRSWERSSLRSPALRRRSKNVGKKVHIPSVRRKAQRIRYCSFSSASFSVCDYTTRTTELHLSAVCTAVESQRYSQILANNVFYTPLCDVTCAGLSVVC